MSFNKVPLNILVVAAIMVMFGLAEVVTAFRHHFFGITTSQATVFTCAAAFIGILYFAAGLLTLTMKKSAARLAVGCLVAVIFGRILLVVTGLYPMNSFRQIFAITLGTAIVATFAIYIGRAVFR
jgi:hypothetical protein